jgi:hypothetical protein
MNDLFFARPVARSLEDAIASWEALDLPIDDEELLNNLAGVAPGFPEAFATRQARDAALGQFGPYVDFVPASWPQMAAVGWAVSSIAIGHAVGDAAYSRVAPQILDAVAERLRTRADVEVIIHRNTYHVIRNEQGLVRVVGAYALFDAVPDDGQNDLVRTTRHLADELNSRLCTAVAQ